MKKITSMSHLETMILSEIKNVSKIYLITKRNSVVNFFKKVVGDSSKILIEPLQPQVQYAYDVLIIIDSTVLDTTYVAYLFGMKYKGYPVLCIIDNEISENIRSVVDSLFQYSIPFPVFEDSFYKNFSDTIEQIKKDFHFDEEKKCFRGVGINSIGNEFSVCDRTVNVSYAETSLFGCFVGNSNEMKSVRRKIRKLAVADVPVLLLGETGTGKSTGAAIIHKLSKRNKKEMKSLNISTVDEAVACSTFFGTTTGAFTDAIDKKGLFTLADKGTLFLDEIGLASNAVQSMLLTVVETGKFRKVGSETFEKSDVRLLFATNSDLRESVKEGTFRKDFFCRICGNVIVFPELRNRKEDIPLIVKEHLRGKNKELADNALEKLMQYNWPGNIRELHQCLDRAILYSSGDVIHAEDIDFGLFSM